MVKTNVRCAGASDPGRIRGNNEDAFHLDAERGIFLVVDGIGGQAAGEKAAEIAVERVRARLERQTGSVEQRVREAIAMANNEILRTARANAEFAGMACVLTLVVLENGTAVVGHVGDSRLYLIRNGEIRKITHDHSPVGEREDNRELNEAEAMRHPRRNEVFRDVGSEEHTPGDTDFMEVRSFPFDGDGALLLCSDGLSDQVPSAEIRASVERHAGNPDGAVQELIDAANRAGGKDNVTVVILEGERFTPSVAPAADPAARKGGWGSRSLLFAGGFVLAAVLGWLTRGVWQAPPVTIVPRTISVTGTIAAAMAEARAGDTVEVPEGEYREQVRLKDGVTLRARVPREPKIWAAPLSGGPAVIAEGVKGARFSGFRILADPATPLSTGISLLDSVVEIDDVEVKGAGVGIEIRGAGSSAVRASAIRDCLAEGVLLLGPNTPWLSHNLLQGNKGAGVAARDGAKPSLLANTFDRNVLEPPPSDAVKALNFFVGMPVAPGRAGRVARQALLGRPSNEGLSEQSSDLAAWRPLVHSRGSDGRASLAWPPERRLQQGLATPRRSSPLIAPISRKIGKYEILRKLGRGGMADVYLANDTESSHTVALKLIEHAVDADTIASIEAERRGAILQASLAAIDPRVVRVYGSGDTEGYFYVAMEYIDGQDLAELMRKGPLEPAFAAGVAIDVARTLNNAHNLAVVIDGKDFRDVVHGDLKPKNIRIDARGEVRVLDFGIAKALSMSRRLTRNEFGSVPYASPERLDSGDVNIGSDLWSLAVMLYEMVSGMQPYQAVSTERLERMISSRIAPPPAPDPCPEPLRRILIKAMAPDPELRYASAHEFGADLDAWKSGRPVLAVSEDLDATRRTFRPREDADDETRRTPGAEPEDTHDETRRTVRPPSAMASGTSKSAKPTAKRSAFGLTMRILVGLLLAGVLYASWLITSNYLLYQHGQQLAREIETEQLKDPDQIWAKWTELSKGNPSSFLLHGPRKVVKQKFVAAADQVIDTYRTSESQTVYEKDWERAKTAAARALAVDPEDGVRGKLRICEGHLARINGTSHRSAQELNEAVAKFSEAQRLLPKSPDPELGLARVYVYGLKDIDKGYGALQQAQRRGYPLGNREKSLLADGYRDRADRLWWDSRNVRGLPAEKDQIQRAADDYKRAEEMYQGISPWGKSIVNLVRVRLSLESVNFRLHQIESEAH